MEDPVQIKWCAHSFERQAILDNVLKSNKCPIENCGQEFGKEDLVSDTKSKAVTQLLKLMQEKSKTSINSSILKDLQL